MSDGAVSMLKIGFAAPALVLASVLYPVMDAEPDQASQQGEAEAIGGVDVGCNAPVFAITAGDSGPVLGGRFMACGNTEVRHVAVYNRDDQVFDSLETTVASGVNDTVNATSISGDDIYVGGLFTEAGGKPANHIARFDGGQWHALAGGLDGSVKAIAVSGDDVYVGGWFSEAGGNPVNHVARWDGDRWHPLGDGEHNGVNGPVFALLVSGDDIYVGGSFTQAGGKPASRVVRWDGSEWHALGTGETGGVNHTVRALAAFGDDVYVGGYFSEAGRVEANHIARWDGDQWHALASDDEFNGVNAGVHALAASDKDVYVGGWFTESGGLQTNLVARWDGNQWHSLGSGEENGVDLRLFSVIEALAISGDDVYVGGQFSLAGGRPASRVARWDGDQWQSLR